MNPDPINQNIEGVRQLVGSKINKLAYGQSESEGVSSEKEDILTLKLDDEELLLLKDKWETKYQGYEAKIKIRQEKNKLYYLGQQSLGSSQVSDVPIAANLLFEAEETFLPAALAKNPEPVVWADNTNQGNKIAKDVKTMLQYHADTQVLRRKLTKMTRHWSIYFIGVVKHGWDNDIQDITTDNIHPQCLVLDPDACIDMYGDYDGEYIGEKKECTASRLIELFPKYKDYITLQANGKLGTELIYTEWWSNEYCFYTFKEVVLDKSKNPHFNYEDRNGEKARNHFAKPKKPYTFLSVFSLGDHPHDDTNLIEQNIPNQNLVSKRTIQIDINLDRSNNSIGFSSNNFNEETAKQAATAMTKGHPILIPGGNINEGVVRFPAPNYPNAAFEQLESSKRDLRSIFGTDGLGTTPPKEQKTLGGLINNEQHDDTRIGGGVGDALEQVADNIFNWWVQLYYVYYDEPHFATIMGGMKATEYITLSSQDLDRRIVVSVSPDSMKPKDEVTEMNQALQLWEQKAIDPKTLLTILNFPDPQETAEQAVLWNIDPMSYMQLNFPEMAQKVQAAQQQAQQAQQQAQQQQMAMEQQGQQQEMANKGAQVQQQLTQKEQTHQQKLQHDQQSHEMKMEHERLAKKSAKTNMKKLTTKTTKK